MIVSRTKAPLPYSSKLFTITPRRQFITHVESSGDCPRSSPVSTGAAPSSSEARRAPHRKESRVAAPEPRPIVRHRASRRRYRHRTTTIARPYPMAVAVLVSLASVPVLAAVLAGSETLTPASQPRSPGYPVVAETSTAPVVVTGRGAGAASSPSATQPSDTPSPAPAPSSSSSPSPSSSDVPTAGADDRAPGAGVAGTAGSQRRPRGVPTRSRGTGTGSGGGDQGSVPAPAPAPSDPGVGGVNPPKCPSAGSPGQPSDCGSPSGPLPGILPLPRILPIPSPSTGPGLLPGVLTGSSSARQGRIATGLADLLAVNGATGSR
jgi:hypothetical protein